ncbi:MAG TPA: hypothetical protein VH475_03265 [Tepidisphaeraceae bacterium]
MPTRRTTRPFDRSRRHGATAVIAMLFLVLISTLAVAMYPMATLNVQAADNMAENDKARAAAESGLRWMAWRFVKMTRPKTTVGNITAATAASLWPSIRSSIANDFSTMLNSGERTLTWDGTTYRSASIATDSGQGTFALQIRQHPIGAGDAMDSTYIRVSSVGTYGAASKSVSVDFKIDKKVKFAIVGKVPIQIGRNTLVEGPIAMTSPNKFPPIMQLSDFRHLTPGLQTKIDAFNQFLENNHKGYDNRISVNNPDEYGKAAAAGYTDYNGDSFVDEYDLFLKEFDKNGDKAIDTGEFTNPSTGKLYDTDLFKAMDSLGAPMFAGDTTRAGYQDGIIDNRDAYTKVRGQIDIAATANAWSSNLAPSHETIQDMIQGPVQNSDGSADPSVKFGVDSSEVFDLSPGNFDTSGFRNKTGPENGATSTTTSGGQVTISNKVLAASDAALGPQSVQVTTPGNTSFKAGDVVLKSDFDAANASLPASKKATAALPVNTANEKTPYGSASWQATYQRPVFKNMHFKNVRIPKGMNALFDNCTFDGVTYVELTTNITNSAGQTTTNPNDGMTWSKKMKSGSFDANTALTSATSYGYVQGNNLRFNNCSMNGPVASDVPTAYTHFTDTMEFTGSTMFNNQVDQTATIVTPQTNIEMGSFTDPAHAPSTLTGVVVAGNLDIRGSSVVDGSIIITGDGAGNTTQGWFGPRDDQTDPTTPMPEGGYGRLNIRYNPYRALPDGINIAIDILPDANTYAEGL